MDACDFYSPKIQIESYGSLSQSHQSFICLINGNSTCYRDMSGSEQTKRMLNQESFIRQRLTNAKEQQMKQELENDARR
ncbi:hypothetical protein RHSIM_Rhsim07G0050200 [Rhododendron simsii]|uniref:Uncharacterized protein n=1 Tax=Rhododendron simsii TaxID=118357 RepID=A0A834GY31_RHOSS|nr:hypothetical protein RHSIM_Rhsim07G0050200 [Rhododendron simsii]